MRWLALLLLVAANLGVRFTSRELRRERAELRAELARQDEARERQRAEAEEGASLRRLADRFQESFASSDAAVPASLDMASVRQALVAAEAGLDLDRLSLDFRPLSGAGGAGASRGSRIQLSSIGPFYALAAYLGRIEATGLPLAPEELRLRREPDGVVLDVRWTAVWEYADAGKKPVELDEARIEAWLERERAASVTGDLFGDGAASRAAAPPPIEPPPRERVPEAMDLPETEVPPGAVPALTGFVLARPELEPDVARRVLAALRFEGEIHLVTVGEALGQYEVAEMEARESVTLVHAPTGERVVLYLP